MRGHRARDVCGPADKGVISARSRLGHAPIVDTGGTREADSPTLPIVDADSFPSALHETATPSERKHSLLIFLSLVGLGALARALVCLRITPVRVAVILSARADTVALALFGSLLLRQVRDPRVAWMAMFMWAVSPYALSNAANGLETSLAVCLSLAVASYFPRIDRSDGGAREFFVFGVLGGLAMLARIDAGFLVAIAGLLCVRRVLARGTPAALRLGIAAGAGVLLTNLPWWIFSYHYTGHIYPDSGRAIREISHWVEHRTLANAYIPDFVFAVRSIVHNQLPVLVVLFLTVGLITSCGGLVELRRAIRQLWQQEKLLLLFVATLFSAYVLYIFGYWFFFRYFYIISVVVLVSTALLIDHALQLLKSRSGLALSVLAAVFAVVVVTRSEPKGQLDITGGPRTLREIYMVADASHRAWMNIGLWAKNHFPAGTIIGCRDSGAIGYFAENLTIVNLDGVVNHDAYEAIVARRLLDYARSVKVQYLLENVAA